MCEHNFFFWKSFKSIKHFSLISEMMFVNALVHKLRVTHHTENG